MYTRGTNNWWKYLIGLATEPKAVIRDNDDIKKFQWRSEGVERQVLITSRKLDFVLPKKAKAVMGKSSTLWSAPKSTMTFVPLPSFLLHFEQDIARQDNRYYLGFHWSIFMGTGPLCWWNQDCESEPYSWDLFERLAWLCRTCHFESQRPCSNPSICQKCFGAIQIDVEWG